MHVIGIYASINPLGILPLKYKLLRLLHQEKLSCPNNVTDEGIVTEGKPLQPLKHLSPNDVTDEGIVTEVKLLHHEKQSRPNDVTDEGIDTEVKLLQPLKQ